MSKKASARVLEFKGKKLSVLNADDGQWWIAIRPICEALDIDYHAQYKRIQQDEDLSQLLSEQTTVGADNKARKMLCLPEKFVYGWLFSLRSDSPELRSYRRECYEVLYNHFHGTLTGRMTVLNERTDIDLRILELEEKLTETDEYKEIQDLKKRKTQTTKRLKELDTELLAGQLSLALQ